MGEEVVGSLGRGWGRGEVEGGWVEEDGWVDGRDGRVDGWLVRG